jgi:hypothetical protein
MLGSFSDFPTIRIQFYKYKIKMPISSVPAADPNPDPPDPHVFGRVVDPE